MAVRENHCWPTAYRITELLATEPTVAMASNRAIAARLGRDERTVERALNTLEKAGRIARFYSRPTTPADTGRIIKLLPVGTQ